MGVLGGAGFIYGVAAPAIPDSGAAREVNAILLGSVGVGAGYVVSWPIALFMPGKTIYDQPRLSSAAHPTHLRWPQLKKRPVQQPEVAQTQP
jgi:hypothetical protein